MPWSMDDLHDGLICCARFDDGEFYRTKIHDPENSPHNAINALFVDYGNSSLIGLADIRLLNSDNHKALLNTPPLAVPYILGGVMFTDHQFESVSWINNHIQYKEVVCKTLTDERAGVSFIHVLLPNGSDLAQELYRLKMARRADYNELVQVVREEVAAAASSFKLKGRLQPRHHNQPQGSGGGGDTKVPPFPVQQSIDPLFVGSVHKAFVTIAEDGPSSFTLQLKEDAEQKLPVICRLIQNSIPQLNKTPLLPGSLCLGRYSQCKALRRAVVMNVRPDSCKVYFRDYGNSEELPYSEIYIQPANVAAYPSLALQFSLAKLRGVNVTNAMKATFRQLVEGREVSITVTQPEENPLLQFCDMFIDGSNVRDMLVLELSYMPQYPPQERNITVVASFLESPYRFYVQYANEEHTLKTIQSTLAEYCPGARRGCRNILVGTPLCALYPVDNSWYRSQVVNVTSGGISVVYVDYGNKGLVGQDQIVVPTRDIVCKWRAQAVECCLIGYEASDGKCDPLACDILERITLGHPFLTMRLHCALPHNRLLVDLISADGVSTAAQLKELLSQAKPKKQNIERNLTITTDGNKRTVANLQNLAANRYDREKFQHNRTQRNKHSEHDNRTSEDDDSPRGRNWPTDNNNKFENKVSVSGRLKKGGGGHWSGSETISESGVANSDKSTRFRPQLNEKTKWGGNSDKPQKNYNSLHDNHEDKRGGKQKWGNRDGGDGHQRNYNQEDRKGNKPRWNHSKEGEGGDRQPRNNFDHQEQDDRKWWGGGRQPRDGGGKWKDEGGSSGGRRNRAMGAEDRSRRPRNKEFGQENQRNSFNDFSRAKQSQKLLKDVANKETAEVWDDDDSQVVPRVSVSQANIVVTEYLHFDFQPGYEFYVRICNMIAPDHFYIHAADNEAALESLRCLIDGDMQASFRPLGESAVFSIGLPVLARYKEDALLYRGVIKQITTSKATTILFVDYGNTSLVSVDELFLPTESEAADPMMAIRCCLADIRPPEGMSNWDFVTREAYRPYLDMESVLLMRVESIRRVDGEVVLSVVLSSSDGSTVSQAMVAQGIAIPVAGGTLKASCFKNSVPSKFTYPNQQPPVPNEPTTKDEGEVIPPPEDVPAVEVVKEVPLEATANKKFDDWPDSLSLLVGQYLPAKITSTTTEDVFYAGITGTALNLECSLIPEQKGILLKADMEVILEALEFMSERFKVAVYNSKDGRPLSKDGSECAVKPITTPCPMPIVNSVAKMFVSHFEAGQIYLQKESDSVRLAEYLENLFTLYNNTQPGERTDWRVGEICCAKSKMDDNWYRARVWELNGEEITVQFVDYGNKEKTDIGLLRVLDEKFYSPEMALGARLPVVWKEGAGEIMEIVDGIGFTCRLRRHCGEWYVDPVDSEGVSLIAKLKDLGYAEESKESPFIELNTPLGCWLRPGDRVPIVVSHIDNPSSFWVHKSAHMEAIENLQLELPTAIKGAEDYTGEGEVFAALYEQDNSWYRASVRSGDTVKFVDYGNYDVASVRKKLPERFVKPESGYAIRMQLPVEPANHDEGWSTEAMQLFESFIENDSSTAEIHSVRFKIVADLLVGNVSLSNKLVEAGLAKGIYDLPKRQSKTRVIVVYSESPNDFYTMDETLTESLENMAAVLEGAANFPPLESFKESDLVIANCQEDGQWYRAQVLTTSPQVSVKFVDYGNVATVTDLRAPPSEEIKTVKPMASHCSLGLDKLNDSVVSQFMELTDNQIFGLTVIREGDPKIVDLECVNDGTKLRDKLVAKVPPTSRLPSGKVFVSHCDSPQNFYIQENSKSDLLDTVQDSLVEAQTFPMLEQLEKGDIVAAKFPEDESWYRAEILSTERGEVTVRFIDYGNVSMVTETRLLPPDLQASPPLVTRCSLELPEGQILWSQDAANKFLDIVSDGSVTFVIKIIREGNPVIVDLLYDGAKSVTEQLFPLVKVGAMTDNADNSGSQSERKRHEEDSETLGSPDVLIENEVVEMQGQSSKKVDNVPVIVGDDGVEVASANKCELDTVEKNQVSDGENSNRTQICTGVERKQTSDVIVVGTEKEHQEEPETKELPDGAEAETKRLDGEIKSAETLPHSERKIVKGNTDETGKNFKTVTEETVANSGADRPDTLPQVFICLEYSLSDFYVQLESDTESLKNILMAMEEAEEWQSVDEPKVGSLYCAKSAEDGKWNRCILTGENWGHFIDFGKASSVSEVKKLPQELQDVKAMAQHCKILPPEGYHRWSAQAHRRFLELVEEGSNEPFGCIFLSEGDHRVVELLKGGQSITANLSSLCSDGPVKVTSHGEAGDFYVADCQELEEVKLKLATLVDQLEPFQEPPARGTHVCTNVDGTWHRGKVVDGGKICLYDIGSVKEIHDLRKLPDEMKLPPPLAIHCRLMTSPQNVLDKAWQAAFKFYCQEPAQLIVLEHGDPIVVDLVVNGTKLSEELERTSHPSPVKRVRTPHEERIVPGSLMQPNKEGSSCSEDKIVPGAATGVAVADAQ
ncbi:hypothetical protein AAG570_013415 [Ranatra chinensis]|uniref:Tudor domain-containing protein n=1 Tax=Ranatra chinensis TaxID=642074 RepID=A0ABD0YC39_9HEMI